VELVRVGSASNPDLSTPGSAAPALDAFEVSCKQDVVRRVFKAGSPEEAAAWVVAVKAAIKARSLYRRETLNGISFLPHGHSHDGAHDAGEAPLVSVITLRKPGAAGGEEVVLAKGPDYHYGHLFDVPYLAPASSSSSSSSSSTTAPSAGGKSPRVPATAATTPRDDAAADGNGVVCILLSNGDSAEVAVQALAERAVGDTVQVKVNSLGGHAAYLPLTVEAAKPQAASDATVGAEMGGKQQQQQGGEAAAFLSLLDVAAPVAFAVLLGLWTHAEGQGTKQQQQQALSLAAVSKDRLALAALVALGLLRLVLGAAVAGVRRKRSVVAAAAVAARRMVLRVSVDDYVHAGGEGAEGQGEGAESFELPPIPARFINGCFGDMVEAERRWRVTLAWRTEFGTDAILEQEHPYYDVIKEALPHFYCKTGKDGNRECDCGCVCVCVYCCWGWAGVCLGRCCGLAGVGIKLCVGRTRRRRVGGGIWSTLIHINLLHTTTHD
jgi:hypothetical protein